MDDIQNQNSETDLDIDKVGVTSITYPLRVKSKSSVTQDTIAKISMFVSLPKHFKGTHMSRFISILNKHNSLIDVGNFKVIMRDILIALDAESSYIKLEFPYFIKKKAPISGEEGLMDYGCVFLGYADNKNGIETTAIVKVPITSVCPCSKAISDRGAHNQRGVVEVKFLTHGTGIWIEDIIELVENSASCGLYPMLKRPDEKWVTETAYDNPLFVEDIVRSVAKKLIELGLDTFKVSVTNYESIHNHSAYAEINRGKFKTVKGDNNNDG